MEQIKNFAIEVFSTLGAGFSERIYHNAMEIQFRKHGISYETEKVINVMFDGYSCGVVRADLIVDKSIVVELKQVSKIKQEHKTQCEMYMNLLGLKNGIVINFPDSNIFPVECIFINN
jgi:GxxExxY protein